MKKSIWLFVLLLSSCVTIPPLPPIVKIVDFDGCTPIEVETYLNRVDEIMDQVEQLAIEFGQTENINQATKIHEEMHSLYIETFLWEIPECAKDLHIDFSLVIFHLAGSESAILESDLDEFDRQYKLYEIAFNQFIDGYTKLENLIK